MAKRAPRYTVRTPEQEQQSRGYDFLGSAFRVEDIIAINLPPDVRQRTRVSKGGKIQRRYTLEIETEPIFHALDEPELGRRAAEVIAEQASENLRNSGKKASAATQKLRAWARERLLTSGPAPRGAVKRAQGRAGKHNTGANTSSYLRRRYDGGRIGFTPPEEPHDVYGRDSGRLAGGMFARLNRSGRTTTRTSPGIATKEGQRNEWIINVPANRLNREQWKGDASMFDAWLTEFRKIMNLTGIVSSGEFESALVEGLSRVIGTLRSEMFRKRRQRLRAQWKVVAGGARLLAVI